MLFDAIVTWSLRRPLAVAVLTLLLVAAGLQTLTRLPVDVLPDLDRPTVTVMTEAPGLAPEEVELRVSYPIESAMNGLPSVLRVRSTSAVGLSIVQVEFDWGSDIYRNRQQVTERLGVLGEALPPGLSPHLGPVTSIMGEILLIGLDADPDAVAPMALRGLADWTLRPALLTLPGVAQITPIGGEVAQWRIAPKPARLRALGLTLDAVDTALRGFATNAGGGFIDRGQAELMIRTLVGPGPGPGDAEALAGLAVGWQDGRPIRLDAVADIALEAGVARGSAGIDGRPAVILSVKKQPGVDTLALTAEVEATLARLAPALPPGVGLRVLFRQADFIETAIGNLGEALLHAALIVAVVLFAFLLRARTTLVSLVAIPVSVLATLLVFRALGLSVNSMTLGGIAIAVGELVDDAIVGMENALRRLRDNARADGPLPALAVIRAATVEVRAGIASATLIIVLAFAPFFALGGIEGRLFGSLGTAYVVAILASMLVSMTLTPVLCHALLRDAATVERPDGALLAGLKRVAARQLRWSFGHGRTLIAAVVLLVGLAAASLPALPRLFLPPFNEGTLTVNVLLDPGASLAESNRIGALAERLLLEVPGVTQVGRRTGRAELDEHAEGVHYSELDVDVRAPPQGRAALLAAIRARLAVLPAAVSIGQPISHRLDHLLSGVRAELSVKVFGEDLDTLTALAGQLAARLRALPGLVDVQVEKQVRVPQLQIRVDAGAAARHGLTPAQVAAAVETLANGRTVSEVVDGLRRVEVVIRLDDADRSPEALAALLIDSPAGPVPLGRLAALVETDGPNQISRDAARRRIVVSANGIGGASGLAAIREAVAAVPLPAGHVAVIEGQFAEQEAALLRTLGLGLAAALLILAVLYGRYRSLRLSLIVFASVPFALVGAVAALWLAGGALSVASVIGFVTLAGIAARNGILKISHYLNLILVDGQPLAPETIIRGSLDRLAPVLMTAIGTALALLPLIVSGEAPGQEILHPVAVVIFGGLLSATLFDTLLTPLLFLRLAAGPLARLAARGEVRSW